MTGGGEQPSLFDAGRGPGREQVELPRLWLQDGGAEQDVVVSSRLRLARNVEGFHFKTRFADGEGQRLEALLRQVLREVEPRLRYYSLDELSATQRQVMFERHLISREHVTDKQPRGVGFTPEGTTSILVNEEDHLRLQVFAPGLELARLADEADALDRRIGARLDYSFDPRFGYRTSCPTNTGTGLRVSVMLHLPALSFRSESRGSRAVERDIVRMQNAAQQMGLTVRGIYGESSRAEGDFYQISNQVTLGRPPERTLKDVRDLVNIVFDWERRNRDAHLKESRSRIEDHVWRAWALLTHARRVSSGEALSLLSALRLGNFLGILPDVEVPVLQELMVAIRPGHLQLRAGRELSPEERDVVRATLLRDTLSADQC